MKRGKLLLNYGWLSLFVWLGFAGQILAHPVSLHILTKNIGATTKKIGIIGVDYESDGSNGGNGDDSSYAKLINEVVQQQQQHKSKNKLGRIDFFLDVPFSFDHFSYLASRKKNFSHQLITKYLKKMQNMTGPFSFYPTSFEQKETPHAYEKIIELMTFLSKVEAGKLRENLASFKLESIAFYKKWIFALRERYFLLLNEHEKEGIQEQGAVLLCFVLALRQLGSRDGDKVSFSFAIEQISNEEDRKESCGNIMLLMRRTLSIIVPFVRLLGSQQKANETILVWGDNDLAVLKKLLIEAGYTELLPKKVQKGKEIIPEKLQAFITYLINCCNLCGKRMTTAMGCGRCKRVRYCGRVCQLGDWSNHKKFCDF